MTSRPAAALVAVFALSLIGSPGNLASAQPGLARFSRQSDVIYGRKFGLALTMEVFAPAKPNGVGVVWVVSSSGRSSREQTVQPSEGMGHAYPGWEADTALMAAWFDTHLRGSPVR